MALRLLLFLSALLTGFSGAQAAARTLAPQQIEQGRIASVHMLAGTHVTAAAHRVFLDRQPSLSAVAGSTVHIRPRSTPLPSLPRVDERRLE